MKHGIIITAGSSKPPKTREEALRRKVKREPLYRFVRELQENKTTGVVYNKKTAPFEISYLEDREDEVRAFAQKHGYDIFVCIPLQSPKEKLGHLVAKNTRTNKPS